MRIKEGTIIQLLEQFDDNKEFLDLTGISTVKRTVKELRNMYKNDTSIYYLSSNKFNYGRDIKHSIRYETYGMFNEV